MEELIKKLQENNGLTVEQSHGVLNTIKDFIKEKFPMVGGMVDNLFLDDSSNETTSAGDMGTTEGPAKKGGSFMDEIPY